MEAVKTCKDCGQTKPREEFHLVGKRDSPGCRESRCKPCSNELSKVEKRNRYRRKRGIPVGAPKWSVRNGQAVLGKDANRVACRKRYWDKMGLPVPTDKVLIEGRWRLPPEEAHRRIKASAAKNSRNRARTVENRFKRAIQSASKRRLEWTITFEQFQEHIKKSCHYWEAHPMPETGSNMDRIDNSKGYHIDNVIPACTNCNLTRGNRHTVTVFKVMVVAKETFLLKEQQELSVKSN